MERDWASTLLPASWNGFPFYVESDGETAGARLPTTDIPNGQWVVENFGRKKREYKVTAYLSGDAIEALGQAFLASAETGEPGILALPMAGFVTVRVKEVKRNFKKDQLGYLAFDLEAQEEPKGAFGFTINSARAGIFGITATIGVALAAGFASRLTSAMISPAPRERAVQQGEASLTRLAVLRDGVRPPPAARATITKALETAAQALGSILTDPGAFAAATLAAGQALGEQADPAFLQAVLAAEAPAASPWVPKWAPGGERAARVDHAFDILTASVTALALTEAVARREFSARPEAVSARGVTGAAIDRARRDLAGEDEQAGLTYSALESAISTYLTLVAADLAPLVEVRAQAHRPSLWWSWRLHGSPHRASEIAARAGAARPLFMPLAFQTVAPGA